MNSKLASAKEHYSKVRAIVKELSDLAMKNNSRFKFHIAMKQFDYILQISLIHAAITDGDFKAVELEFIKDITEYGSVVGLFNVKMEKIAPELPELTWENIIPIRSALSDAGKTAFLEQMTAFVDEIAKDFVKWFAPIDAENKKVNYLSRINTIFDEIIAIFATCDGENDIENINQENTDAKKIKKSVLISKWKKAVGETA